MHIIPRSTTCGHFRALEYFIIREKRNIVCMCVCVLIHRDCFIGCLLLCSTLTSETWSLIGHGACHFSRLLGRKSLGRSVWRSSLLAIVIDIYKSTWLLYRCWNPNSDPRDSQQAANTLSYSSSLLRSSLSMIVLLYKYSQFLCSFKSLNFCFYDIRKDTV